MYAFFLITACLCVSAFTKSVEYSLEDADRYFEDFIKEFDKQYANEIEKETRFQIFKKNLEDANRLNKEHPDAVFGITAFMDLTTKEFVSTYTCLREDATQVYCDKIIHDADIDYTGAPESFDWRDKNVVTPVKDQGGCGSCWAFSATACVESQYAIKHREAIPLSEQELMDCDENSDGCGGGFMSTAMKALIAKGGQMKESDYKYEGSKGKCRLDKRKIVAKVTDCTSYNLTSQEKVKQVLYKVGPISIGIQAAYLNMYTGGIFPDKLCLGKISHGVLLVGYGTENGKPYWLVKNSWSHSFGERGYFRLHRSDNPNGACQMLNDAMTTATVE
ncbi:unnamed protein product [Arctia plantaginis]|uniref:Uncharacterized protein n=1 Tax=Arctia plantaginis TaxID=874455 RepID=A0A8S0ZYN6_ARCPL|nr:unnamed protein product [Arctia plantaginis]